MRLTATRNNPMLLLLAMAFVLPLVFSVWNALLNNFVVEKAQFTGAEIGMLQSLREVPGFLAFSAVFLLLVIKEQTFAMVSLAIMSIGVALTGFFPFEIGLYCTTVIMSVGFHYFETINQSLTLQWVAKESAANFMGQQLAVKSFASLFAYGSIWLLMDVVGIHYQTMYMLAGGLGLVIVLFLWGFFAQFKQPSIQHKQLFLRKRYWLYYCLTFFSGARRQIFMVFASFMMVEKFGYSVGEISLLFIINYIFNLFFAAKIGSWIAKVGERTALTVEYIGLLVVFISYAIVTNPQLAAALYVIDHLFFAMAIAMKTYFQKIADPKDIASTAGVSFTINHIAAVVIPALLGIVWLTSPSLVFYIGAAFAFCSLLLALNIPDSPNSGNEVRKNPFMWANKPQTASETESSAVAIKPVV
ncbi:MFS transporter [Aliiglaciecola lipolytica]|uniref:Major facilitator superfamily MFS_1 n=1 Tax=Aliiglaciecola lipolytica E3 TaxID=1127673 RepID=K6YBG7_9ALTE|nr:MFS transporter [Aliiglaciecola lipolytica]GAC15532.1 major facilitator superfamily MFS_1 [Aliiglaciecola lipolytica E3]